MRCSIDTRIRPAPGQVRGALRVYLARQLGWSDKSPEAVLQPLTDDEIAACLKGDPQATRAALLARSAAILSDAARTVAAAATAPRGA